MPHHWPKATTEARIWCNRCNRETMWRIADGRQQYCLTCYDKRPELEKPKVEQGNLFERRDS